MFRSLLVALPVVLGLTGCSGYVEERVVVRHPVPPPREEVVVYADAPPPPRVEVVTVRPGPGYAYERGRWSRRGHEWVWVGGHWHRG